MDGIYGETTKKVDDGVTENIRELIKYGLGGERGKGGIWNL